MSTEMHPAAVYQRTTHIVPAAHPRHPDTVKSPDIPLKLSVDEFSIVGAPASAFTLIFTHGNSYNKQFWTLIIDNLLSRPLLRQKIGRVLTVDTYNHGDSYLLNKDIITRTAYWPDVPRDFLAVLRHFQCSNRVIGIGHSYGGGTLCRATLEEPGAFTATIFVDPIMFSMPESEAIVVGTALKRRDRWGSLDELEKSISRSRAYAEWDERQRRIFIDRGTIPVQSTEPSPRILKTPKEQEAANYIAAPHDDLIGMLAESTAEHHFVFAGKSDISAPQRRKIIEKSLRLPSTTRILPDVGHL
ncbi:Peroxisomal membrane protein LPX1 [Elsinoe australis]|uniref:Peroxisomal membrane protein LPX1 n=1 Tax=Elsinoe australis TaxID=40998 RepID=A0A2P7ZKB4_9PEZI|nr:Peroxisomal membrane protein LPX1 [Elsinoe australis]